MRIPATVIGVPLIPAVKKSIGTAVTMPVAGSSNYSSPWSTPYAPVPVYSLYPMKARDKGTIERDSINTDTWL